MANKSQKAQIHILRDQLGMSDADYRAMLGSYGVSSSADEEFTAVKAADMIRTMRKEHAARTGAAGQYHGWGKNKYEYLRPRPANMADPKQLRKIEAMWRDIARDPGDSALETFIKNHTGIGKLVWLEKTDARDVLTALKEMKKQVNKESSQTVKSQEQ